MSVKGGSPAAGALDPATLAAQCEGLMPHARVGEFYGPSAGMALGAGIIVRSVAQPVYLPDQGLYGTGRGPALVLSHECDIDPENIRPFNDRALVAPLIRLDRYLGEATKSYSEQEILSFASNVARGNTTRVCFLPRYGGNDCPLHFGALIDLNNLTSCGVNALADSETICSLSGYAIMSIDRALQNHLFRPKADRAPLPH